MISVRNVSLTIKRAEILKSISVEFEDGKIHGLTVETEAEKRC